MLERRSRGKPGKSGSPRTVQDEQMRDAIVATARGLIQHYGLRKTTMDDIARAMGKERTALYYYFPGKKEIVNALVDSEFAAFSHAVHEAVARHTDVAGRLRAYLHARVDQVVQRGAMYEQIMPELRGGGEGVPDIFRMGALQFSFNEREERYLADLVSQGVRDKQFQALPQAKIRLLARFILSAVQGCEQDLFMASSRAADLKSQLDVACDIVIKGLQR